MPNCIPSAVDKAEFRKLVPKLLAASVAWTAPPVEDIDSIFAELDTEKKGKLPIADVRSILLGDKPPPTSEKKKEEKEAASRRSSASGEDARRKSDEYAWEKQSHMLKPRGSKKVVRVAPIAE